MIQFNLLPDVKLEYMKAQSQKRLVVSISTIASIAAVSLFVILLLVVDVWQKKSMSDVNADINTNSSQLQNGTTNLNKILTVQNQLSALATLHNQKPVTSRLFGYITQITPAKAYISTLNVNFTLNTLTITGTADSAATVNTFVDTLKFTTYKTSNSSQAQNAFTQVVLSSQSITSKSATYTINANFPPDIFSEANDNVTLTVPQIITTRSVTDEPVFKSGN